MPDYSIDPNDPLPRYYQVYLSLRERIHSGEFGPGDALPAERQLCVDYSVSRITVIKAKDLLERDELIEQHQGRGSFVLDQEEPGCRTKPCRVVFCLPTFADSYLSQMIIGAVRVAMREGIQLELIGIEKGDQASTRVRNAIDSGVDGVLLLPYTRYPDLDFYQELQDSAFPLVLLDRYYPALPMDWVVFDDEAAGYALTNSLIARGHRRIAIITDKDAEASSVRGRIRGYRRALEEAGLDYDENLVCVDIYADLSPASVYNLKSSHLRLLQRIRQDGFTAMVAVNLYVALQLRMDIARIRTHMMRVSTDARNGVGEDAGEIVTAAISNRALNRDETSLVALAIQSGEVLGERAMEVLLHRLSQGRALPPQQVKIPMEILEAT